uniref:Methyltransferase type 12 n=1 Tax=Solibacter usitatus (strain Ellin6076) TaxID=234267 RepID=Q01VI0_SOLUE
METTAQSSIRDLGASFRDPGGAVFLWDDRVFRAVNALGEEDLSAFLDAQSSRQAIDRGQVIATRRTSAEEAQALLGNPEVRSVFDSVAATALLEHERIAFPTFPYEWIPEMLHAAAGLTLDLAESLLADGIGLKDATPYNILFRGPAPIFIDVLSFERRRPGDPTWLPYAQFARTFLLPLLAHKRFGIGLDQILTTRRDGLEPEEVYRWAGPLQRLTPTFLSLVSLPTWLGGKQKRAPDANLYTRKTVDDSAKAEFILRSLLGGARRTLAKLAPTAGANSAWSDYMDSNLNYSADHFAAKQSFVSAALAEFAPKRVLDVGCNTGHFSAIAARAGAAVVSIDYDPVVLGQVWRQARAESLDILPLAVNLARPTPSTGWRNRECPSFLERARGGFDAVLMLAVIHHMLVTERVPLNDILKLAAELTRDILIVEFVSPEDAMFQRIVRGREELHQGLTNTVFEAACRQYFEILRVQHLEGATRWLYLLRKSR